MMQRWSLALGLVLATSTLAVAQQTIVESPAPGVVATPESWRISQLIGSNVALEGNNQFGKVEDVVLQPNGNIGYLVVSNNGRYAMMPWNAANINYGQRTVMFNVAPQAVQPLFFERNAWPSLSDQVYTGRIRRVFPNAGVIHREVLRPAAGTLPPPAAAQPPAASAPPPAATAPPPAAATAPPPAGAAPPQPAAAIEETIKERKP
jgi:hypothetical protein